MNNILITVGLNAKAAAVGVGVGVGVTCFLPWQEVQMADGTLKPISEVKPGDKVVGRWGVNTVRGVETPRLGKRHMYLINNRCFNTFDHPQWTQKGWSVIDKNYYSRNDYGCECVLFGDKGTWWKETYTPCHPDNMNEHTIGETILAIPGRLKWEPLTSIVPVKTFHEDQVLYSLALTGDRTMYVDGFCFSGWADEDAYDYQARVGT